ncbi:hypothetical protein D5H75_37205 [Bailinhaonella thermotolerans]|uniref:ABC transporter permease n=1 Tax=Bailinhaonella thermotolerans TaxID=1070861 RepID=A0A3A4A2S7_9ACTN|nr:hypothetical protein D5H75_37205 [Bailinhaonella thermotolerans]
MPRAAAPSRFRRAFPVPVWHVLRHLWVPLFLAAGMALAYVGAFSHPEPHHVDVAVVAPDAKAEVLAQHLQNQAGDRLDVRTVPARGEAEKLLRRGDVAAVYVPGAAPALIVDSVKSGSTVAETATKTFTPLATAQNAPLRVTDLGPIPDDDYAGGTVFFLLVALSLGGYTGAIAVAAAGAALSPWVRALLGLGLSLVTAIVTTVIAGPVAGAVHGNLTAVAAMGWIYASGVMLIGLGLHTFLGKVATPVLVGLFVMLNLTSSGGLFAPELQPGFFATLSDFWNGSAFVDAGRRILYQGGDGMARDVWTLVAWLAAGVAVLAASAVYERRAHRAHRPTPAEAETAVDRELDTVAVA